MKIQLTEADIKQNTYYNKNPQYFIEILNIIQQCTNYAVVIKHHQYLLDWLDEAIPQLTDKKYTLYTKLYWLLHNQTDKVYCPNPDCNNEIENVIRLPLGYLKYCSISCLNSSEHHIKQVNDARDEHILKDPEYNHKIYEKACDTKEAQGHPRNWVNSEKCKETKCTNHNDPNYSNVEQARKTRAQNNNGKWHADDFVNKCKKTCLKNNGIECILATDIVRTPEIVAANAIKRNNTKKKNNSFSKSKDEDYIYDKLVEFFGKDNVNRQHKSDDYPFFCDFFIPTLQLYIEYQGSWTHGFHPYDATSLIDQLQIEKWQTKANDVTRKNKKHNFYKQAIYVWTDLDVRKRTIAKSNNLNFLEFFNLQEFDNWLQTISKTNLV